MLLRYSELFSAVSAESGIYHEKGKLGFRSRNIIIISLFLVVVVLSLGFLLTRQSNRALISQIQGRMLDIANTASDMVNGDELKRLEAEDRDTEEYQKVIRTLKCFMDHIDMEYIYCIRDMGNKQFVLTVDPTIEDPGEFGEPIVYTDALYQASLGTAACKQHMPHVYHTVVLRNTCVLFLINRTNARKKGIRKVTKWNALPPRRKRDKVAGFERPFFVQ